MTTVHAHHDIDVSKLKTSSFDEASPLWWGNLLLIFIETTTVVLMLSCYFYLRQNYDQWPPPKVDVIPPLQHPVPDLSFASANALLLVLSCLPMYWTNMAARRKDRWKTGAGLTVLFVISIVSLVLRWQEFPATKFSWNDNAYASVVWTTLGLHLTYILIGALEFAIMGAWIYSKGIDSKHALDVTLAGGYWYWVAGTGAIIYLVIFWSPRWI
jgi:heme/copper-type cytochrome/quinol oxidase subunit 3